MMPTEFILKHDSIVGHWLKWSSRRAAKVLARSKLVHACVALVIFVSGCKQPAPVAIKGNEPMAIGSLAPSSTGGITITPIATNGNCLVYTESDAGTNLFESCSATNVWFTAIFTTNHPVTLVIETSTNLKDWTVFLTSNNCGGRCSFSCPNNDKFRFYRARI
jgi:hypothetical protein